MNELNIINITKLCTILKDSLPTQKYKITGEVSQPKLSQGHLYLTLKDNKSSIKAIIWKTKYEKMKNKLCDGDKITVYGSLDYYNFTGTISLIIDNIVDNEGVGELQKKYDFLKEEFKKKGYYDNKNKLPMPKYITNILIITSSNGAAIQDFIFNLANNKSKIKYEIIDVPVQGYESPKIISNKLKELNNMELNYDLIIITRGGGSYQDLFGFSDEELIESVFSFTKIPIISAIGHQIDNPLLDLVADYSCPTPSLASQFIVDINKSYIANLIELKNNYKFTIIDNLHKNQKNILNYNNRLKETFNELYTIQAEFKNNLLLELNNNKLKLDMLLKSLDNPNIELYDLNYTKIINPNDLIKNNILIMRWNNQEFKINIL